MRKLIGLVPVVLLVGCATTAQPVKDPAVFPFPESSLANYQGSGTYLSVDNRMLVCVDENQCIIVDKAILLQWAMRQYKMSAPQSPTY